MDRNSVISKSDLEKTYGIRKTEVSLLVSMGLPAVKMEFGTVFLKDDVEQFIVEQPALREFLEKRLTRPKVGGRPRKNVSLEE